MRELHTRQPHFHACRHQIISSHNQSHTRHVPGIIQLQLCNVAVGNGRAEEVGKQRTFRRNIIHVAAATSQKTLIFQPDGRLAFAEFFQGAAPCLMLDKLTCGVALSTAKSGRKQTRRDGIGTQP